MTASPTVFISYSHKDEARKDRLVEHLAPLRQAGLLHEVWHDREIEGGAEWEEEIFDAIDDSSVALFLVSKASLGSDYIMQTEAPRMLARLGEGRLRILPVLLEPCDWEAVDWLKTLQIRPTDAKDLSGFGDHEQEEVLASLAREVRLLVKGAGQRAETREWVAIPPEAISTARLPVTGEELVGRELQLELLDGAWVDDDTFVLSIVALEIAERSSMPLFECDAHLEHARLDADRGETASALGHLETAKRTVERTGYHRRDREVKVLERVLAERGD